MQIQSIRLENYRMFRKLTCNFDPAVTVLMADNGGGKTTILDAIRVTLGVYCGEFLTTSFAHVNELDVHTFIKNGDLGQRQVHYPAVITAKASLADQPLAVEWRCLRSRSSPQTIGKGSITLRRFANKLLSTSLESDTPQNWPVVAYYGTARLWTMETLPENNEFADGFDQRVAGYKDCLNPASSYATVLTWLRFVAKTDFAAKMKFADANPAASGAQLSAFQGPFTPMLNAVRGAINLVLASSGWRNIYYSETYKDALVEHDELGTMAVSQLSDGIRNTVALVADLAYRAVQLNPHLGEHAALEAFGVVLIDEVDMHLHPSWQQTILSSLRAAFPKIQFIVTTHSPQVLSTVRRENIRIIGKNKQGEFTATSPLGMSYGEPSGHVLHGVMGVDQLPPIPERADLQRLTSLVDQGAYSGKEAQTLLKKLTKTLGEHHPQLQQLQRSKERQEFMKTVKFE